MSERSSRVCVIECEGAPLGVATFVNGEDKCTFLLGMDPKEVAWLSVADLRTVGENIVRLCNDRLREGSV